MATYDTQTITALIRFVQIEGIDYGVQPEPSIDFGYVDVKAATITLDEAWSPYCQAVLTCAIPGPGLLAAIDPRENRRVLITVTQTAPFTGTPFTRTFDLQLQSRKVNWNTGELDIGCVSDEAFLIDNQWNWTPGFVPFSPAGDVRTAVNWTIDYATYTYYTQNFASHIAESFTATVEHDSLLPTMGQSYWQYLEPILQPSNLRLWCDENRQWHLAPQGQNTGNVVVLNSMDGILTDVSDTIDRGGSDWYDAAYITYTWTDPTGATQYEYDDYESGDNVWKPYSVTYETRKPAGGAAAVIVRRMQGRGRSLDLSAVNRWDVTPGDLFTSTYAPGVAQQTGVIASVQWQLPAGEMTVRTRDATDVTAGRAWINQPKGVTWASLGVGVPWNSYQAAVLWNTQPTARHWETISTGQSWDTYTT